ncbi:IclR family transcriptional regulator [Biomaibacter acetigenes]|uniref:IclR family transcriptional regulator n=1 Tax=Biomaibacter acetigenes TaxID=2316383 RepID=A0A3G2R3L8_9FIRM|nr:IclR family transcriptional regulator [Biomaibacter acetigenes]AYO29537.1 IclR family transcriptional regulator [Biomaibacter acetigenes]
MSGDNTVIKALKLLNYFTTDRPIIGLNELSRLSGYPKASVYRLLCALEKCGFVTRSKEYESDRRYQLGIKLFELGMQVYENIELNKVALPFMKELKDQINEAIQLVVRDGDEALYIEKIDPDQVFRLYTAKGRRAPLYAGASGRVLLAGLADEKINSLLDKPLKKFTDKTPVSKEEIWEKILFIRRNKFSISKEELWPTSMEIAVPIYDQTCSIIASLSAAGPIFRMTEDKINFFVEKLQQYASLISHQLGFIEKKR